MTSFLAPSRTDLDRIAASLATITDPATAWCTLAERGAIPTDWVDDPNRRFIHDPGDVYSPELPTRAPMYAPVAAYPSSVATCARIASDISGMRAAEAAARDHVERLAPWGAPTCDQFRWWSIPATRFGFASTDTRPGHNYALMFAASACWRAAPSRYPNGSSMFGHAADYAAVWNELAAANACVSEGRLEGRSFAELPNPFEGLAAIEATGYATLEGIGILDGERGAVVLICPS